MTTINAVGNGLSGSSGTGAFVGTNSPTLVTPTLGVISATSINFGGDTLDTYLSQGTFTPTFTFTTPGDLSVSYSTQTGYYTQIGSVVFITLNLNFTPTYTSASGAAIIGGLPVASSASVSIPLGNLAVGSQTSFSGNYLNIYVNQNDTVFNIIQTTNNSLFSFLSTSSYPSAQSNQIIGSAFYFT